MSRLWKILLWLAFAPAIALATPEDICPGGSAPRSDVKLCSNATNLTNCIIGNEVLCMSDNNLTQGAGSGMKANTCPVTPAVNGTTGCYYSTSNPGGNSLGYANWTLSPASDTSCQRWYYQWGAGSIPSASDVGGHAPGFNYGNGSGCTGYIGGDLSAVGFKVLIESAGASNGGVCGAVGSPGSWGQSLNVSSWAPKNGAWYWVDMCVALNTPGGTTGPGIHQGDGQYRIWVNDTLVYQVTDLNFRGSSSTAQITGGYGPRLYVANGYPDKNPNVYFSGFAWTNNTTKVGRATSDTLGTPVTLAPHAPQPYYNFMSYNAYVGTPGPFGSGTPHKTAGDCSQQGYDGQSIFSFQWGLGASLVSSPVKNGYTSPCSGTNGAMEAATNGINQQSGDYNEIDFPVSRYAIHSQVYFKGTNDYTNPVPVLGFTRYNVNSTSNVFAVYRTASGHIGLVYRNNDVESDDDLGTALSADTYHDIELEWTGSKVTLLLDGTALLDEATPGHTVLNNLSPDRAVWGIIRNSPSTSFKIDYDDSDLRTVSAVDCHGWDTDCPYSGTTTTTTTTTVTTTTLAPNIAADFTKRRIF